MREYLQALDHLPFLNNGSVLLILGRLIIGIIADSKKAEGIKPFTTDIFKGFLAMFLLEALGLAFPFNISLGMPIYFAIVAHG